MSKAALLAPMAMALVAGAVLPFQAAANSTIGRLAGHPLWAALVSLGVSVLVIVPTLALMRVSAPITAAAAHGPWWLWIGGVLGAIYVAAAASVTPKLGAGGFLVCVVAGQMVAAVLVDHFGLMGLTSKPINLSRIAGVALILGGVLLIQGTGAKASTPTESAPTPAIS